MDDAEFPPLDNVWMDCETILGRAWLHLTEVAYNADTMLYFYAALELRFAIESVFFELLARLKRGGVARRDLKAYRPSEFDSLLRTFDPDYLAKSAEVLGFVITAADVTQINALYGQLGRCLHLPREPFFEADQAPWLTELETTILKAYHYLNRLTGNKWPAS